MIKLAKRLNDLYQTLEMGNDDNTIENILEGLKNDPDAIVNDLCTRIVDLTNSANNLMVISELTNILEKLL